MFTSRTTMFAICALLVTATWRDDARALLRLRGMDDDVAGDVLEYLGPDADPHARSYLFRLDTLRDALSDERDASMDAWRDDHEYRNRAHQRWGWTPRYHAECEYDRWFGVADDKQTLKPEIRELQDEIASVETLLGDEDAVRECLGPAPELGCTCYDDDTSIPFAQRHAHNQGPQAAVPERWNPTRTFTRTQAALPGTDQGFNLKPGFNICKYNPYNYDVAAGRITIYHTYQDLVDDDEHSFEDGVPTDTALVDAEIENVAAAVGRIGTDSRALVLTTDGRIVPWFGDQGGSMAFPDTSSEFFEPQNEPFDPRHQDGHWGQYTSTRLRYSRFAPEIHRYLSDNTFTALSSFQEHDTSGFVHEMVELTTTNGQHVAFKMSDIFY